ncbi:little elongation complex subunit 1 isoform X3 [Mustela erminea]|uniref:little elongation complex subunit 1 isoform X3 n=1 Tax=Mustela erminea TaxID=36723 RepID=UPI0013867D61|nr:little elongation complex subunit 1 isoform X3 [Mustela erminea]
MMPGETHSAAPGTAADLSRCQGCASLQQNLNEYVEALITLKQKIINTDNLLTEYQKKCDELQFARRENSTLHHQVEQMLQKISPLQKCQEELGSLKAELEEKKSSLKLYQDTHQEYARVKEECLKTDAQKKKLEAKVKKLEEAAVKQTQDFKQLRNEKKILEKEFKKTQEQLDEFSKQKNEKELRHIGTQISSDSYGSIDKRKVKLLLKELWLCINTTHRLPGEGSRCITEKPAKENPGPTESRDDGVPPPAGGRPLQATAVQTCLAELSMEIEGDFSACRHVGRREDGGPAPCSDRAADEGLRPERETPRTDEDNADFSDRDRCFDEDLQAAVDFFRRPPPLLSPVPSPPLVSLPPLSTLPSSLAPHLAECLLHSILSELKTQKTSMERNYIHALCRVYVGICRQLGDLERARLFCYSLLKEDFPESEKLTLFIANMWHDIFISQSVINKAMQLVARQRAKGEVRNCLRAFLNWEKNAPVDVGFMVSKLLLTIQLCPKTEFQSSEKFGEDLSDNTWEYIFAIDLLCCHQKWIWTHDNIISKELWPVMDKWIKYRKGHANIAYTPDIIIASILRLIGRLGQLGLKEGFPSAVKNISSVIGMFIQHARDEDIPWGIQLAAVYALCDLSPSNPAEISKILEAWRQETAHSVPSAVLSCLEEVSSLCAEEVG